MIKRPKNTRLFDSFLRLTEEFMKGKNFVPLTRTELMKKLHLSREHKEVFQQVLKALVKKGATKFSKGRYHPIRPTVDTVSGSLSLHPRGFGFVKPDNPSLYDQDIFIPKHLTQNAVDGDRVEVEINPFHFSDKGPEGRIVAITERGRTHLAGVVCDIEWHGDTLAYAPLLGKEQRIVILPTDQMTLRVGDRVIMEVLDWGATDTETICKVTHYLGHISDPKCDIPAAVEEFELRKDFPKAAKKEVAKFGTKVSAKDIANRTDLRNLECITIDPDTAKDFDDALSITKDEKGNYHLGVHIADVSHYVQHESALDEEAKARANSTYFPGRCIPMIPPELSENLCSLRANVNRLTASVLMTFDSKGNLINYNIERAVIKSRKRFTYKEAKLVLEGKKKSPHAATLHLMVEMCELLKRKRYERGSVEFALPSIELIVDDKGTPLKTEYVYYDITHQLVEEFMLKANETVAWHLSKEGKDLSYRVHEEPAEQNMQDFVILAEAFGFRLPENPSGKDLQEMFDEALKTPYGHFLATSYIRRMRLALYSAKNIGHYGLGLTHYCHFTSPIRRYVDLVVHRILFGDLVDFEHLEEISRHCSEQERISERAENSVVLLKKLRLLKQLTDNDPYKTFEAVVTRIRNFGIYFELSDFMIEGFLHLSELDDDFYQFSEEKQQLFGNYTGMTFFAGDRIQVMVKDLDFILREVKWYYVSERRQKHKREKKRKKRK